MSGPLRFALLADGPGDRALLSIIAWVVREHGIAEIAQPGFRVRGGQPIRTEIATTLELYQPDLLFVHRDAERVDPEVRRQEIPDVGCRLVRIVPVRMTEAWLLFDEAAIREAVGRPRARAPLGIPPTSHAESLPDPKLALHEALLEAAEARGRGENSCAAICPT